MRRSLAIGFMAGLTVLALAMNANAQVVPCSSQSCPVGTAATTKVGLDETFYICPTLALAEYTNLVVGLVWATLQMTGRQPSMSSANGEPVYGGGDETNETNRLVASRRLSAEVPSFFAAVAQCRQGSGDTAVVVVDSPAGSAMSRVRLAAGSAEFWIPRSQLGTR